MRTITIVAIISTLATGCLSSRPWSVRDVALESAFVATEIVDYQQTRVITGQCREANPVIGACGQNAPINLFFPLMVLANVAVADLLPGWWRTSFQVATTAVEARVVEYNYAAGIR